MNATILFLKRYFFSRDDSGRFSRGLPRRWMLPAILFSLVASAAAGPPTPSAGDEVIAYLNQTIDWYRQVKTLGESNLSSQELLLRQAAQKSAQQVVGLGFDYARAQAQATGATPRAGATTQDKNLARASANASTRVTELQSQLAQLDRQYAATSQPAVAAQRDVIKARLNLATAQRDAIGDYARFMADAGGSGISLSQKIEDLARGVPDASDAQTAKTSPAKNTAVASSTFTPENAGILGLISRLFVLSGRMRQLNSLATDAEKLAKTNEHLRAPIRSEILASLHAAPTTASTKAAATGPATSLAAARESDAINDAAVRFRQISAIGLPLGEQNAEIEAARQDLLNWRAALASDYGAALRSLLVRLAAMGSIIAAVIIVSLLWRRATIRYVHDLRRQRQLMLVRRIVVSIVVVLIIIGGVATEFGSIATFAGLITAGIAVALQTVILSGVAYFFFIGRFGVRVGDRVTISNITGDVVEVGIFRLYLMELTGKAGDLHPTGRLVVFSNSVLFQPTAFYKQLPGVNYAWRELAFTLAPDTDYKLAEKRLLTAVQSIFDRYSESIEREYMQSAEELHIVIAKPEPQSRLRFVDAGIEFVVRYPVEIHRATEIDDEITRKLLQTINEEPKLKLVSPGAAKIQPAT